MEDSSHDYEFRFERGERIVTYWDYKGTIIVISEEGSYEFDDYFKQQEKKC